MRRPSLIRMLAASLIALAATVALPATATAAELQPVTGFGSNPGNLAMYAYVPDGLPAGAPAVVLLHGCTQDAATYVANSGWRQLADAHGFALIAPQQSTANNANRCFTWFEPGDTTRDQGEALSIRQMVGHAVTAFGIDPARVSVSGLSAGGAMTSVMLAAYPDVFASGSIVAGIPYGCATSMINAFSCMNPGVDRTPAAWGDAVRNAASGHGARVAVWHGTADYTVAVRNGQESRDQWTDVLGTGQTPTSTGQLGASTTVEIYGADQVRLHTVTGMGHGTPVAPAEGCGTAGAYFLDTVCSAGQDAAFFGLTG